MYSNNILLLIFFMSCQSSSSTNTPQGDLQNDDENSFPDLMSILSRLRRVEEEIQTLKIRQAALLERPTYGAEGSPVIKIDGPIPLDCDDIIRRDSSAISGIYAIRPRGSSEPFPVYCDMDSEGNGWTVFQRRINGNEDFDRGWMEYEHGFGNLNEEFWLGLSRMQSVLLQYSYTLRIELHNVHGEFFYAEYARFRLGTKKKFYRLRVTEFLGGNATNALHYHNGFPFTTFDEDNDKSHKVNCAMHHHGGWWFRSCDRSNLNGLYRSTDEYNGEYDDGIEWKAEDSPEGPYSTFTRTVMKVKPAHRIRHFKR